MNLVKKNIFKFLMVMLVALVGLTLISCDNQDPTKTETNVPTEGETTAPVVTDRTVNGRVLCGSDAVVGATVKIRNTSYETTTDNEGKFTFVITESTDDLGDFRILISAEGYVSATKDVLVSDFTSGVVSFDINLESNNITLSGIIKDKDGNPVDGAEVLIDGTEASVVTDATGAYSFALSERPQGVILKVTKDYYKKAEVAILDLSTGSSFVNDITLEDNLVSINGVVSNNYSGVIAGATVTIKGTEYTTTSDAEGKYQFDNVLLPNENYQLEVAKEGYLPAVHASDAAENLELIANYWQYATISLDDDRTLEGYITKSSHGLHFKYLIEEFKWDNKEEKVQVYINPGKYTEASRQDNGGSHTIEIALTSNNGICVFVNYLGGTNFVSNILWGTEVAYTEGEEGDKHALYLYVDYDVFGEYCGVDFAIDDESIIGLGLNFYSNHTTNALANWYVDEMPGADGKAVVNHANPQDWLRLSSDGTYLYEGSDNVKRDEVIRTISGVITDGENPVAGVEVEIPLRGISAVTDAEGRYSLEIPAKLTGVSVFDLTVKCDGFVSQKLQVIRDDFADNAATKDVVLVAGNDLVTVHGVVKNLNGEALAGATVTIKGTEISTTTDAEGKFSFVEANYDVAPYSLVIKAEGYYNHTVTVQKTQIEEVLQVALESKLPNATSKTEITTSSALAEVGTLSNGAVKVSLALNGGLLKLQYVYDSAVISVGEIYQFIKFDTDTIYRVSFKEGWTGVWNVADAKWETWTPQINNPVYAKDGTIVTASQVIDLAYFTNLGLDVTKITLCPGLSVERTLEINGEYMLVYADQSTWLDLTPAGTTVSGKVVDSENNPIQYATVTIKDTEISVVTNANGEFLLWGVANEVAPYTLVISADKFVTKEVSVDELNKELEAIALEKDATAEDTSLKVNLSATEVKVGTLNVGKGDADVYMAIDNNVLTMKYVYAEGALTGEVGQYFKFDTDTIYEVRFNNAAWTGIWNVTNSAWEAWNDKIAIPTYTTADGVTTLVQTIDLAYFANLGCETSAPILCVKVGANIISVGESEIVYANPTTWMNLIF